MPRAMPKSGVDAYRLAERAQPWGLRLVNRVDETGAHGIRCSMIRVTGKPRGDAIEVHIGDSANRLTVRLGDEGERDTTVSSSPRGVELVALDDNGEMFGATLSLSHWSLRVRDWWLGASRVLTTLRCPASRLHTHTLSPYQPVNTQCVRGVLHSHTTGPA